MKRREDKAQWQRQPHKPQAQASLDTKRSNWLVAAIKLSNFLPGLLVGFLLGLLADIPTNGSRKFLASRPSRNKHASWSSTSENVSEATDGELKMVFVVRQDLKMGGGKIASQCAHAAVGMYSQLMKSDRALITQWESCGQPKIVVSCKNQNDMNELRSKAETAGLPTYTIADAGRTQVAAGSKTVLVIGPGPKPSVDAVTRHLRLL